MKMLTVSALRSTIDAWGTTDAERAESFPCDALVDRPDRALFRAIDVDAPVPVVFRWLCQLRVAPYSYDWLDNRGRRSPRHLIDGLDELEVGQTFMTIFEVVDFERGRSVTIVTCDEIFGRMAGTYRVRAIGPDRTRLVAKLLLVYPAGIRGAVLRRCLPAGDLVMMRKQFVNLKRLAARTAREGA